MGVRFSLPRSLPNHLPPSCLQGGNIRGSINLPAQSLYPSIPTLYRTLKAAGVRKVIWYCGKLAPSFAPVQAPADRRGKGGMSTSIYGS